VSEQEPAEVFAAAQLVESEFDFDELRLSNNAVEWRGYSAKAVVFCEGYQMSRA
jgi:hypothetical protein